MDYNLAKLECVAHSSGTKITAFNIVVNVDHPTIGWANAASLFLHMPAASTDGRETPQHRHTCSDTPCRQRR
jgi:hypothetical protein